MVFIDNSKKKQLNGYMSNLKIDDKWIKEIFIDGIENNSYILDELKNNNISINTGILLYSPIDDSVILGVFKNKMDYCHFGGGKKKNESIYEGAIRELKEESLNCININEDIIKKCPCIITYDFKFRKFCYVVFIAALNDDINQLISEFDIKKNDVKNPEIIELVSIKLKEFNNLLLDNSQYDHRFKEFSFEKKKKEYKLYDNLKDLIVKDDKRISIKEIFKHIKKISKDI